MRVRNSFSSIWPRLKVNCNFKCCGFAGREKFGPSRFFRVFLAFGLFALVAFLVSSPVTWAGSESKVEPFEVFRLRHISARQGQKYLGQLKAGTVSALPGQPMLLVTGGPSEMRKARSILKLVDSPERYVIREISSGSGIKAPSGERISAILGEIEIGTFSNPPVGSGAKAIVDVHDNCLVVVGPLSKINKVIGAFAGPEESGVARAAGVVAAAVITDSVEVESEVASIPSLAEDISPWSAVIPEPVGGVEVKPGKVEAIGPVGPVVPDVLLKSQGDLPVKDNGETNGLFGRLLESLSEAEAKAAERAKPSAEKVVAKVVEKAEPVAAIAESNAVDPVVEKTEAVVETAEVASANEVPQPKVVVESNEPVKESPEEKKEKENEKDAELEALMDRINSLEAQLKSWSITDPNEKEVAEPEAKVETKAEADPKAEPKVEPVADANKAAPKIEKRVEEPNEAAPKEEAVVEDANIVEDVNAVEDANTVADANADETVAKQSVEEIKAEPKMKFRVEDLPNADDVLKIGLPKEPLLLVDFLDFVGKHLHLDYLYDPEKMKTIKVNLRLDGALQGEIRIRDLYPLLESVLFFHDFIMTEKDGLMIVRPITEVGPSDPLIVSPDAAKLGHGNVVITTTFKLEHIDTSSAQNLLSNMNLGVKIIPVEETRTLIVTGYAHRMGQMEQLLEMVDKPGTPKEYRSRQLKYTMAELLAPKLKTLAEQIGTVSVTVSAAAAKPAQVPSRAGRASRARGRTTKPTPPRTQAPPRTTAPKVAPDSVYLEADPRTNRILMIGRDKQLSIVEALIDSLDVEQQDLRLLRLYEIKNVDAEEVRLKLQEFGLITATRTTTRGRTTSGRRTQSTTRSQAAAKSGTSAAARDRITSAPAAGASAEKPLSEEPQVVIIETINALLVNATPEQHVRIATIIRYVDSEPQDVMIPYIVYPLENQKPEDLAATLNELIQETTEQQDKAGKIQKTTALRTEEEIIIISDENTFSLIVYASKKNQQWISSLIKQLDKRRPQVLIDVTLVQITKDDIFNFDLDLIAAVPDLSVVTGAIFDPGSVVLPSGSGRSRFLEFGSVGGTGTGFYADSHINALLTTMQTKQYGRVMSRPKLLVNDNEAGTIQTTKTTYVTRTSTSIIGTDNPQSTESTSFDDYSAGITLDITPHISEGDMLRLEITLNRSDFLNLGVDPDKPPDKADEDVTTVVTVPDRSTIILGGLETVRNSKGGDKIPILGDLPIIGGLFRSVSKSEMTNKLYIFVKAHILRPGQENTLSDLKDISLKNREAFEKLEREMDDYEDWPGLKPVPMDPPSVLEADSDFPMLPSRDS